MKNLTLEKLAKIVGTILFIIILILNALNFFLYSINQNIVIIHLFLGFYLFGTLFIMANSILEGDYFLDVESFIKKHLPLVFFKKGNLKFDILSDSNICINVTNICFEFDNWIDNIKTTQPSLIKDILFSLNSVNTVKITGNIKNHKVDSIKINKSILINFLKKLPENKQLNKVDWSQFEISVTRIDIYCPFLNYVLTFFNLKNELELFEQVEKFSTKEIIHWMLFPVLKIFKITNNTYGINNGTPGYLYLNPPRNYKWINFENLSLLNKEVTHKFINNDRKETTKFSSSDNIEVGQSYLFSEKYFQNKNSSKIIELMNEIDQKLKDGFEFNSIKSERWNTVYKSEIEEILNSKYSLTDEMENRILKILISLKDDMFDNQEKQDTIWKDTSISALESMLKMDGIENQNNLKSEKESHYKLKFNL